MSQIPLGPNQEVLSESGLQEQFRMWSEDEGEGNESDDSESTNSKTTAIDQDGVVLSRVKKSEEVSGRTQIKPSAHVQVNRKQTASVSDSTKAKDHIGTESVQRFEQASNLEEDSEDELTPSSSSSFNGIWSSYWSGFPARMKRGFLMLCSACVITFIVFQFGGPVLNKLSLEDELCVATGAVRIAWLDDTQTTEGNSGPRDWTHVVPVRCVQQKMVFGFFSTLASFYEGELDIYTGYMLSTAQLPSASADASGSKKALLLYRYGPHIYQGHMASGRFHGPGLIHSEKDGSLVISTFSRGLPASATSSSIPTMNLLEMINTLIIHPLQKKSLEAAVTRAANLLASQLSLQSLFFGNRVSDSNKKSAIDMLKYAFVVQPHYTPPVSQAKFLHQKEASEGSSTNKPMSAYPKLSELLFAPVPAAHAQSLRVAWSDELPELRGWVMHAERSSQGFPRGTVFIRAPSTEPPSQPLIHVPIRNRSNNQTLHADLTERNNTVYLSSTELDAIREEFKAKVSITYDSVSALELPKSLKRQSGSSIQLLEQGKFISNLVPKVSDDNLNVEEYKQALMSLTHSFQNEARLKQSSPLVLHSFLNEHLETKESAADHFFPLPRRLVYEPETSLLAREEAYLRNHGEIKHNDSQSEGGDLLDCSVLTEINAKGYMVGPIRSQITVPLNFLLRGNPKRNENTGKGLLNEAYLGIEGSHLRKLLWSIVWTTSPDLAKMTDPQVGLLSNFGLELVWEGQGSASPRYNLPKVKAPHPTPDSNAQKKPLLSCPDIRHLVKLDAGDLHNYHGDRKEDIEVNDETDDPYDLNLLQESGEDLDITPQDWKGSMLFASYALRWRALPASQDKLLNAPRRFNITESEDEEWGRKLAQSGRSISLSRLNELAPTLSAFSMTFARSDSKRSQYLATWIMGFAEKSVDNEQPSDPELRSLTDTMISLHQQLSKRNAEMGVEKKNITKSEAELLVLLSTALRTLAVAAVYEIPEELLCPGHSGKLQECDSLRMPAKVLDDMAMHTESPASIEEQSNKEDTSNKEGARKASAILAVREISQVVWKQMQRLLVRSLKLRTHAIAMGVGSDRLSRKKWSVPDSIVSQCRSELMQAIEDAHGANGF